MFVCLFEPRVLASPPIPPRCRARAGERTEEANFTQGHLRISECVRLVFRYASPELLWYERGDYMVTAYGKALR